MADYPILENWSIAARRQDEYTAPELRATVVQGTIYNSPKFSDGDLISTSLIQKMEDGLIETYSGSVYKLGTPDPNYVEYCNALGYDFPGVTV